MTTFANVGPLQLAIVAVANCLREDVCGQVWKSQKAPLTPSSFPAMCNDGRFTDALRFIAYPGVASEFEMEARTRFQTRGSKDGEKCDA